MPPVLRCLRCGESWSPEHGEKWGRTHESLGNGPEPRCSNMVENPSAPKAPTRDPTVFETPRMICGGTLMPVDVPAADAGKARKPRPV